MEDSIMSKNIKFVIAIKYYSNKNNCDFISTLAHEFAGEQDVVDYSSLKDAIHFDTKEVAENILKTQPEWVKRKNKVIAFEKSVSGCYLILNKSEIL